ncbi:MAG TPA: wax ester/triacylglycerol synthase family O-acyltransferase, partial [Thermoanaerobaculia bacterium]|nr:wax ester/triacylglycerol synthase family O-acyltransferase [Thermoanaerobaculia bacterium]
MISEPLTAVDTAWLHMEEPTNLMMVTGFLAFDEVLDFGRLTRLMQERLLRAPRLTQRVVEPRLPFAPPRWETDPTFDIRAHLHRVALHPPGDDRALRELVSDLMSTPLDFTKPLWQFHLVEGYGRGCALVGRFHHALGDGVALVRLILSMADGGAGAHDPAGTPHEPHGWERVVPFLGPATKAVSRTLRVTEGLVREGVESLAHPEHLLEIAARGASGADALAKLLLMPPDPVTPFKGPLGVEKVAAWSDPIPLDDVKAAGRALGATVNDVLLAAVTGALRRYLDRRGAVAANLEFRAVVPVNLRRPEEYDELGNRFGLVYLSLPVGIEDPLDRLFELKERMDEIKRSPEAIVALGLLGAIGTAPIPVERLVVELFGRGGTGVMTNVAGPRQPIRLAGALATRVMFWVPQSGRLGLGVSILSYAGGVSLGVATDAGLVPDPEAIREVFRE